VFYNNKHFKITKRLFLLKMMLLNLAGLLHELSFNISHCIKLENKVMTRGMYICKYVSLFRLLAACNMYIYTHTRAREFVSFLLLVYWFLAYFPEECRRWQSTC